MIGGHVALPWRKGMGAGGGRSMGLPSRIVTEQAAEKGEHCAHLALSFPPFIPPGISSHDPVRPTPKNPFLPQSVRSRNKPRGVSPRRF